MLGRISGAALAVLTGLSGMDGVVAETPAARESRPVVHVCERGNYAERALKREHGAAPFATAAEVLAAARSGTPGWSTPRCMTGLEYARLDDALRRAKLERQARVQAARVLASR